MHRMDWVVVPLRVLLVLVFVGLLVAQFLSLPGEFRQMADEHPELGVIPWLLLTFAILEVLCFQVVIVCTWRLLTLVQVRPHLQRPRRSHGSTRSSGRWLRPGCSSRASRPTSWP